MSTDGDLLLARHQQLAVELETTKGDEFQTLGLIRRYLSETGIDPLLIYPVMRRMGELRDEFVRTERAGKAGAPKPSNDVNAMAMLAALATAMHNRQKVRVPQAIKKIAKLSKVEKVQIESFRKNVISEILSPYAIDAYKLFVKQVEAFTEDEFDAEVSRFAQLCGGFLRTQDISNR